MKLQYRRYKSWMEQPVMFRIAWRGGRPVSVEVHGPSEPSTTWSLFCTVYWWRHNDGPDPSHSAAPLFYLCKSYESCALASAIIILLMTSILYSILLSVIHNAINFYTRYCWCVLIHRVKRQANSVRRRINNHCLREWWEWSRSSLCLMLRCFIILYKHSFITTFTKYI